MAFTQYLYRFTVTFLPFCSARSHFYIQSQQSIDIVYLSLWLNCVVKIRNVSCFFFLVIVVVVESHFSDDLVHYFFGSNVLNLHIIQTTFDSTRFDISPRQISFCIPPYRLPTTTGTRSFAYYKNSVHSQATTPTNKNLINNSNVPSIEL